MNNRAERLKKQANAAPGSALAALLDYAAQRPNLDPRNYGPGPAYRTEANAIAAALARVEALALALADAPATNDELIAAASRSFSGRLSFAHEGERFRVNYTTGQYWPTEYRKACAAVLQQVIDTRADQYGETAAPHTFSERPTWSELKALNAERGGHFWEPSAVRFFRSRNEGQPRRLADGRAAFVYSIAIDDRPGSRFYKVATMDTAGDVDTLSNDEHPTRAAALAALRAL